MKLEGSDVDKKHADPAVLGTFRLTDFYNLWTSGENTLHYIICVSYFWNIFKKKKKVPSYILLGRTRSPCGLRCRSAAAQLLGSRVRIPQRHGCSCLVLVVWCVGSGLCDKLISRSEDPTGCVCRYVIQKPQQWGGLGQSRPVAPQEKKKHFSGITCKVCACVRIRRQVRPTVYSPYASTNTLSLRVSYTFPPLIPWKSSFLPTTFLSVTPFHPLTTQLPPPSLERLTPPHLFSFILLVSSFSLRSYSLGPDSSSLLYNFSLKLTSV